MTQFKGIKHSHDTSLITLKKAHIDKGIAKVVNWLNSFDGIYTRHSCQGNDAFHQKEKGVKTPVPPDIPYVLFYCDDPLDLICVASKIKGSAVIEVEFYPRGATLRYWLKFNEGGCTFDFFVNGALNAK